MENSEKMFRLMNHDSNHNKPQFEVYTVEEHNRKFGTNYVSVEEAVDVDPEYLFTEEEIKEYLVEE